MAKAVDFHNEVSKSLECNVCMSLLHNPKVLKCQHWFCKDCIDELLEFTLDGSAVVTCPLKCRERTFIGNDETTNILPIPYQLTSILDLINSQDGRLENGRKDAICNGASECENNVSLYCPSCSILLCQGCSHKHSENHHNTFLPIQFDKKSESWMVVCNDHSTWAKFLCCKDKLVCLYCKYRHHYGHHIDIISETAEEIRKCVASHEEKRESIERIIKNTVKSLEATKASINHSRDTFAIALKNKKVKCLSEYSTYLNNEEEKLLAKYDVITSSHILKYPEPVSGGYFQNITKKHDFQIVREKHRMRRSIYNFTSDSIPSMRINLTESKSLHKNPLGKLNLETVSYLSVNEEQTISSFHDEFIVSDQSHVASDLLKELEILVEEVLGETQKYKNNQPLSPTSRYRTEATGAKQKHTSTRTQLPTSRSGSSSPIEGKEHNSEDSDDESQLSQNRNMNDDNDDFELKFQDELEKLGVTLDNHFEKLLNKLQDQCLTSEYLELDEDGNEDVELETEIEEDTESEDQENFEVVTEEGIDEICKQS